MSSPYIACTFKMSNTLTFKITEKACSARTHWITQINAIIAQKYKSQKQPCAYSHIPQAHTPAQTQNTQPNPTQLPFKFMNINLTPKVGSTIHPLHNVDQCTSVSTAYIGPGYKCVWACASILWGTHDTDWKTKTILWEWSKLQFWKRV